MASVARYVRDADAVATLTTAELALIPAGTALIGVVLGIGGNRYLDRHKEKRAEDQQDQAIAELLTATVDLVSGIHALRALIEIRDNLQARIAEADHYGWLGEIAGLQASLAAVEKKLEAMRQLGSRHLTTHLGMPDFRATVGRVGRSDRSETRTNDAI